MLKISTQNTFCNCNRTEWSPIQSVIIQVITKSRESDLFITSMIIQTEVNDTKSCYQLIIKITIFTRERRRANL